MNRHCRQLTNHSVSSGLRRMFTPDLNQLNKNMYQTVFFHKKFGEYLGGFEKTLMDKRVQYFGGAVTLSDEFQKRRPIVDGKKNESYPIMKSSGIGISGNLEGFVAALPVSMLCELDLKMNHTKQTQRYNKRVWLTSQKPSICISAWIYLYKEDYCDKHQLTKYTNSFSQYFGNISALQQKRILT